LLQQLPEEEVEGVLGRGRYERRKAVDAAPGYRNGHGKPRRLSAMTGTTTLRRLRVRGLEARFESRLLPLFKRRTEEVGRLLPELYLHGLARGDFDLPLRGLLGEAAPLSAPSSARLKAGWQAGDKTWKHRQLDNLEPVYMWAERLVTFYAVPTEHWKRRRTTNVVESPFAAVRLRTAAAKRFKKVENATAVIWKTLLVAEQSFRRLDAPERLPEVAEGVVYVDGVREKRGNAKAAA